jgi:phosphate transport system substrate-binding protein
VVQGITKSINGIGYSGVGYKTSGVVAVPLASKQGQEFVEATADNAVTGKYPLSRLLFIYVNKHPNKPLPPLETAFIKMIMSKVGQMVVVKDGYIPLPAAVAAKQLALTR